MRFSIFYEHQLPQPWDADSEHRLLKEAIEQVRLADRLGYDTVWEVEHHFLEEYSHSSASDVFLAACSQITKDIRLGFGILPLPPGYQHPARVAETAATLDLVSDGRVELGTGETSSGAELAGFGVDRDTKRAQWAEALEVVARMMVEQPFAGIDGRYVSMPPRNVIPKPLQKPHPPLWVACSRRETIRLAAEKGIGALSFSFVEPEEAKVWVDEYYDIIASDRCVPAGFAVNANVAVALPMMVHADEAEAIERGIDGAHFFGYALAHYYVFGEHQPGRTSVWQEFLERREDVGFARSIITADQAPLGVKVLQQGLGSLRGAIGTPDQLRELVRRYEDAGVDELIFVLQTGKTEHQHIMEALELFAADVMPEFAARRDEHEAAKRERLGNAPLRALERRAPPQTVEPGYSFGPGESGEPEAGAAATAAPPHAGGPGRARVALASLRRAAETRGEQALQAFVKRSGDRRLEKTIGSRAGLKAVFAGMERQFVPERAAGFTGDIQYDLRAADGAIRSWTVSVDGDAAKARTGPSPDPKLKITMSLSDFVRLAGRDLDPVKALLTGRLDLAGDFAVAARLGEMFGQPSAF
ncbi:MAG TPA: LLM class flavin-dependent oxidoreductase [Baekduia sp.]|uniref:LLM class flavin-dependent oxidoreductase n=1 Tax=Baekduia sp. TaxID=2600305 RepID=UPI002BE86B49|nr:LLM class flavin-dependent oxidoreductase [Baekduia sp.]HMJ36126.1 LLM class flavin-dependent oxidoreductase [Baekduia sp.]